MILETAYSSQTKLIGQTLPLSKHGTGYANLTFEANKGQKANFQFQALERTKNLKFEH